MRKFRNNRFVNKHKVTFSGRAEKASNRFIHRAEVKRPKLSFKHTLAYLGFIVVLIFIGYALFSPWLQFQKVEIKGNKILSNFEIEQAVERVAGGKYFYLLSKRNLLLFPNQELENILKNKITILNLKISKNFFKKSLLINLQEKEYNIIWQEGGNYYHINYDGEIVLSQNSPVANFVILENKPVPDKEFVSLVNNKQINIDSKYLAYTQKLDNVIKENNKGLKARTYFYDGTANAIKIKLLGGPIIVFNTEVDPMYQLHKLDVIRQGELRDGRVFNSKESIDLRFGNQVSYIPQ